MPLKVAVYVKCVPVEQGEGNFVDIIRYVLNVTKVVLVRVRKMSILY